jgi:hypothetical protein
MERKAMKPDYLINKKEHVMTYDIFRSMTIHEVGKIIGGLKREKRTTGKKVRKESSE